MPKKTLRGKRHIRARKIIAIKRIEKRIRKFERAVKVMKRMAKVLPYVVRDAFRIVRNRLDEVRKAAQ